MRVKLYILEVIWVWGNYSFYFSLRVVVIFDIGGWVSSLVWDMLEMGGK